MGGVAVLSIHMTSSLAGPKEASSVICRVLRWWGGGGGAGGLAEASPQQQGTAYGGKAPATYQEGDVIRVEHVFPHPPGPSSSSFLFAVT